MKITRNLIGKNSGLPVKGLSVVAKNVATDASYAMPEVPSNSGKYESPSVSHGTYEIIVGSDDTLDEITVEDGRFKFFAHDKLIDSAFMDSIRLSSFISDESEFAQSPDVAASIMMSEEFNSSLLFDVDSEVTSPISTFVDLYIDLCGNALDLQSSITCGNLLIRGGAVNLGDSCDIIAYNTLSTKSLSFIGVTFTGNVSRFVNLRSATFVDCDGIYEIPSSIESVFAGHFPFGTSDGLKLTDYGVDTGDQRRKDLDAFMSAYSGGAYTGEPALISDGLAWLMSGDRKKKIDDFIASYTASKSDSIATFLVPETLRGVGYSQFIEVFGREVFGGASVYKYMRGSVLGRYQRASTMESQGASNENIIYDEQVYATSGVTWTPMYTSGSIPAELSSSGDGLKSGPTGYSVSRGAWPKSYVCRARSLNVLTGEYENLYVSKYLPMIYGWIDAVPVNGTTNRQKYRSIPITISRMIGSTLTELAHDEPVIVDFCFSNNVNSALRAKEWWSV